LNFVSNLLSFHSYFFKHGTFFGVEVLFERFQPEHHSWNREFWKSCTCKAEERQEEDSLCIKDFEEDRDYPTKAGGPRKDGVKGAADDGPPLHH
jgi:hypothetical protein